MKVKNSMYREFLDGGYIQKITIDAFKEQYLPNIEHEHLAQARALVILLWATGARPSEVLNLYGKDIDKQPRHLRVIITTTKIQQGTTLPKKRHVFLPLVNPVIKELWKYISSVHTERFLFYCFRSSAITRKGTPDISCRLRYWFKKWFDLPPYYFRHNRASIMAETLTAAEIARIRGTTILSTEKYIHLSEKQAKKVSRELVK